MKKLVTIAIPLATLISIFVSTSAEAQDGFDLAYGDGIHHFFNGEYQKAYDSLTAAIGNDPSDPRTYYFRGLAGESLGYGSLADFQTGAQLEVRGGGRMSLVNESLERVQGSVRIKLERARSEAITAAKRSQFSTSPVIDVKRTPRGSDKRMTTMPTVPGTVTEIKPIAPGQDIEMMPKPAEEMMDKNPDFDFSSSPADEAMTKEPDFDFSSSPADEAMTKEPDFDFSSPPADEAMTKEPDFDFSTPTVPNDNTFGGDFPDPPADSGFGGDSTFGDETKEMEKKQMPAAGDGTVPNDPFDF